jgi:hypothetical protein
MSDHGSAQLDLIRRYARTLREMHADARRPRATAPSRPAPLRRPPSEPIRQALTGRADIAGARKAPTLPAH